MADRLDELYLEHEGAIYSHTGEAMRDIAHIIRVAYARQGVEKTSDQCMDWAGELMFKYLIDLGYLNHETLKELVTHGACICGAPCAFLEGEIICSQGVHNI